MFDLWICFYFATSDFVYACAQFCFVVHHLWVHLQIFIHMNIVVELINFSGSTLKDRAEKAEPGSYQGQAAAEKPEHGQLSEKAASN